MPGSGSVQEPGTGIVANEAIERIGGNCHLEGRLGGVNAQ
jgi:hypothetical protein